MEDMKKVDQKQKQLVHEDSKKKERHIVTWTQEEDDILRTQIGTHGTENWAIIASKFNDKTTRQCRRRWYTYLNSDFKKGGWSPEEDMLLCEAQKIFGNRWTEIAKVVSGRTDNAVKNRFNTLCKKRAKYEALAKENNTSYTNSNNKRIIFRDAASESAVDFKKMRRSHIPDDAEKINFADRSHKQNETPINSQQSRAPLAVLAQNSHNVNNLPDQQHVCNLKFGGYAQSKIEGTFLKKDDPKINALMQQAELLTSLALKVDAENMDQSLENAWKILQDFLNRNKESDTPGYKIPDLQLVDLQDLLEDLKNSSEEMQPCWRYMELYEDSPGSSEHSTGSISLPHSAGENLENSLHQESGTELNSILHHSAGDNLENSLHQDSGGTELNSILHHSADENLENSLHQDCGSELNSIQIGDQKGIGGCGQVVLSSATLNQDIFSSCDEQINNDQIVSSLSSTVFNSPLQVTPMFRSLAAGIPSPQFSESERNFLMKTLGMESPSLNPIANPSQPPTCKRALLQT